MSEGGPRGGGAESALRVEAGSGDSYVPRTVSPTRTLALLANSGDDLSSRHGTVTTTDWGMLTEEECDACVAENEMVYLFDADNTGSVDIICNNCCGLGHIARVCPSPRRNRTLGYAVALLQQKQGNLGKEPPRRPPGRGQRPPFQTQPRRFQPALRSDGSRFSGQSARPHRRRMFSAEEGEDDYSHEDSASSGEASLVARSVSSQSSERLESAS